jgi:hypothetical protein
MSMVQRVFALATLVALSSCVKSDKIECVPGYADCGGSCVRPAVDAQNCGACGKTCPSYQSCVAGACVATCESSLHAPLFDSWGYAWDGLERPPAAFKEARSACTAIGGRLPNVSELLRVSAPVTGAVGDVHKTNPLWTIIPDGAAGAITVILADGDTTTSDQGVARPYRCVCPAARPAAFAGGACNGPAATPCAPMGGNARFNFDAQDRPAMPKSAAIAECAFVGGELPTAERLASAVSAGLPNGSGNALHTADDTGHFHSSAVTYCARESCILWFCRCVQWVTVPAVDDEYEALVSFTGAAPTITDGAVQSARPFRCFGPAAPGAVAASVPGGFREPGGERTVDAGPDNLSTTYTSAIVDCLHKGGHLPTVTELAAMATQGLPAGGSSAQRLTADQGYLGYAVTYGWSGTAYWPVDPDLATTTPTTDGVPYLWSATSIQDVPNGDATGRPYRCLYYGVDPAFPRPAGTQCSGGCFEVAPGTGTSVARPRMWFDSSSRGGAAGDTYATALTACAASGGRLASTRDLVEAIRSGLDNASGDAVVTSELARGPVVRTLTWSGSVNPAFADTGSASVALGATGQKYRCMWTNEIR